MAGIIGIVIAAAIIVAFALAATAGGADFRDGFDWRRPGSDGWPGERSAGRRA